MVRNGEHRGATGKKIVNFVACGIGGSYLGPDFVHEALKTEFVAAENAEGLHLRFLANVDPVDVKRATMELDAEETMVIVISKTFTTRETLVNAITMRDWLQKSMVSTLPFSSSCGKYNRDFMVGLCLLSPDDCAFLRWIRQAGAPDIVKQHMVACSSAVDKATEFGIDANNVFGFWDWVGGRYSVCSAVGALPLSLQYGFDTFERFLAGARSIDDHFASAPLERNIPVLMGLIGIWNISFLQYKTRAMHPYTEALVKLPAHIQQVPPPSDREIHEICLRWTTDRVPMVCFCLCS